MSGPTPTVDHWDKNGKYTESNPYFKDRQKPHTPPQATTAAPKAEAPAKIDPKQWARDAQKRAAMEMHPDRGGDGEALSDVLSFLNRILGKNK